MARQPIVPVLGDQGQNNFTTRSQGYRDTALGTLFSGVADTANAFIGAADRAVRRNIQEEIRAGVSEIFENVSISTEPESGTASATQGPATALPNDARVDLQRIKKIRQKWEAGKISTTHMHTASAALMKNLKSRYSGEGYRQLIDSTMASYGFNPSNQVLRENIAAQAAAKQSTQSNSEQMFKRDLYMIEKAIKDGTLPKEYASQIIADPYGSARDPKIMAHVRATIATEGAKVYAQQEELRAHNLEAARNKTVSSRATRTASANLAQEFYLVTNSNSALASLRERLKKSQQDLAVDAKDGIFDPSTTNEAVSSFRQYELKVNEFKEAWKAKNRSLYEAMSPDEQKNLFRDIDDSMDEIRQSIVGNKRSVFESQAALVELRKDSEAAAILRKYPNLQGHATVRNMIGDVAYTNYLNSNQEVLNDATRVFSDVALNGLLRGHPDFESLNGAIKTGVTSGALESDDDKRTYARRLVNTTKAVIQTGQSDREITTKYFYATFGPKNKGFMLNVQPEDRAGVYLDLTSPATRSGIQKAIDKGLLPPDAWNSYVGWTTEAFNAVAGGALAAAQEHNRNAFDNRIAIDEKTGFFKVEETGAQRPSLMGQNALAQRASREYSRVTAPVENARNIVGELNTLIAPLKEGYEKTNTDTTSALRRLVPGNFFPAAEPAKLGGPTSQEARTVGNQVLMSLENAPGFAQVVPGLRERYNNGELTPIDVEFMSEVYARSQLTARQGIYQEMFEVQRALGETTDTTESDRLMEELKGLQEDLRNAVSDEESYDKLKASFKRLLGSQGITGNDTGKLSEDLDVFFKTQPN